MIAGGAKPSAVAELLGISEPTLRKHFAADFETATELRRAEMIELAYLAAKTRKPAAIRAYFDLLAAADRDRQSALSSDDAAPHRAEPRLGKKEQVKRSAQSIQGKFAPPPPPGSRSIN